MSLKKITSLNIVWLCKKTPKYFVILVFDSVIYFSKLLIIKNFESLVFGSFLSKTRKNVVFLQALVWLFIFPAFSQNNDCSEWVIMKDTMYHTKQITGFGNVKEFEGYDLANDKFFEEEKNSIWYLINIPDSGLLSFDILTNDKTDDWDFILFEYKTKFCKRIADKKITPIRSNLSRSSITGLSKKATPLFVKAGINPNYSKAVLANKGDQFILIVNNPKKSGKTHTLVLHLPQKKKEIKEIIIKKEKTNTLKFQLSIKDQKSKTPVPSTIIIRGLSKKDIELEDNTKYEAKLIKKNYDVNVTVSSKGFMLTSKNIALKKTKSSHQEVIYLIPIQAGQKVNLKNIQFYGNRADFLPSAKSSLKALLFFMKENPTVKIEVEGHVNGPGQRNSYDYKQLSNNRALAVKKYLVENNIQKDRIEFIGYGNTKMLYPYPKNENEQSANRRVEIKILSNDFTAGN